MSLFYLQFAPAALAPVLEAALSRGSCFYDVGANIGIYSLWASRLVGEGGEVHSFEPVLSTASVLQKIADENSVRNLTVNVQAVGRRSETISLRLVEGASGLASAARPAGTLPTKEIRIRALSLDEYASAQTPPVLIKIDVEGYEPEVLEGMEQLLEWHHPQVIVEALPPSPESPNSHRSRITGLFARHGYEVYNLSPRGLRPSKGPHLTTNVLAADPQAHAETIRRLSRTKFYRNQTV